MQRINGRTIGRHIAEQGTPAQNNSGSLRFDGRFVWSYDEPIGVLDGNTLYVTTAKFSMTTSHHRGSAAGGYAVGMGDSAYVQDIDHGDLRQMVREAGLGGALGRWGADHDHADAR